MTYIFPIQGKNIKASLFVNFTTVYAIFNINSYAMFLSKPKAINHVSYVYYLHFLNVLSYNI